MFVCFGQRFYGKVDVVPGVCHVATRFFYVQFFPLVPLQSCILIAGTGEERCVPTSMSVKSVLVAWLRAGLVVALSGAVMLLIIGGVEYSKNADIAREMVTAGVLTLVAAAVIYWASVRLTRAGFDRAIELGLELGIPREAMEQRLGQLVQSELESDMFHTVSDGQRPE